MPLLVDSLRNPERVELMSPVARATLEDGRATFYETLLQNLIHWQPDCLPLRDIDAAFADMKAVCRELNFGPDGKVGPVDNLLVNASGQICLIDCKPKLPHEAATKVAQQVLGYATALKGSSYEALVEATRKTKDAQSEDPLATCLLGPTASKEQKDKLKTQIERRLKDGRFLIVLAGERIAVGSDKLADALKSKGTLPLTFGLIDMAIYASNAGAPYVVQPRLVAKGRLDGG
jgi:hypothetical protein